jgi:conjugal transfer pilus assembly protein TraB
MSNLQALMEKYKRSPRVITWGCVSLIALLGVWWAFSNVNNYAPPPPPDKPRITTAKDAVSPKDLWLNRIERTAEDMHRDVEEIKNENQALKYQVDSMQQVVERLASTNLTDNLKAQAKIITRKDSIGENDDFLDQDALDGATPSPEQLAAMTAVSQGTSSGMPPSGANTSGFPNSGFKILSLSEQDVPKEKEKPKSVEEVIPAGTYAAGILTTGIAANTSLNAQSDPQPAMVRITNKGMLPRGFRADIKEAVIIAACYGDISSERANCRLNKLLLVERNGEVLTRKVEGWLIGDDGIPGVKGKVIDRAGEVVRGAFWAGLLSGMANYFKATAQQPMYTLTGAGAVETKQQDGKELLKASGANGMGSALEKIADFALKRAEQMQPVIIVNPGRVVDVVFKEDVDLSNSSLRQELTLKGQADRENFTQREANSNNIQLQEEAS